MLRGLGRIATLVGIAALLFFGLSERPAPAACVGDCNDDGSVST